MSTAFSPGPDGDPSVTELVSGIVGDVQDLGKQHLALFRNELKKDIQKAAEGATALGAGLAVTQMGGLLLCLMLVHILSQCVPSLSIWVCYGVVGGIISVIGAIIVVIGYKKLNRAETLSPQSTQAMKEDIRWLTTPK